MLIKVRWKTFPLDMLRIQGGFGLFGIALILMVQANLGTSAWSVLEVALSNLLHLSLGTVTILDGFLVLIISLILRERIGWGTLANILSIGLWEDFFLRIIPSVNNNLPVQITMMLVSVVLMGLASAIYIGVDAGAGPRDTLMLAIQSRTGMSIRLARGIIEVSVVLLGWLLGGPAGVGTVVVALLIGPAVQWGFKVLKVEPHRDLDSELEDG